MVTNHELHVAIIAALDQLVSCDVWDAVPTGAEYPYVTVDVVDADNQDLLRKRMDRRRAYINIWSRHPGQAEVLQIMDQMEPINGDRSIVAGRRVVSCKIDRRRTQRDADNLTFMGQVTLLIEV